MDLCEKFAAKRDEIEKKIWEYFKAYDESSDDDAFDDFLVSVVTLLEGFFEERGFKRVDHWGDTEAEYILLVDKAQKHTVELGWSRDIIGLYFTVVVYEYEPRDSDGYDGALVSHTGRKPVCYYEFRV